jgi:anaerobic magnesium-protoporphyrin IX monomethyl ester cyclase
VHHSAGQIAGFPLPDRGDFDHRAYQREWAPTGRRPTTLLSTLGCPYGCEFCSRPVFGREVRTRPLDAVFAEIGDIVRLGYDSLWIADDTFTLHRDHLEEFCRRVSPLGLSWSCLSRANGIEPATARLMRESGCRRVYLGLESGSQATLDLMRKQTTVEQGARAANVYREAGIEVAAFFIVGYPGETAVDIEETFAFALGLPLAEISFNVPMPLPGSSLWGRLGGSVDGRDWAHENETTFVFSSDIDEAWLRRRIDETMTAFAAKQTHAA